MNQKNSWNWSNWVSTITGQTTGKEESIDTSSEWPRWYVFSQAKIAPHKV
jgi:hypothetical protein